MFRGLVVHVRACLVVYRGGAMGFLCTKNWTNPKDL